MSEFLHDGRDLNAFIPSNLDDLGLTLEAFRVYCHLVRRANKFRDAWPSYQTIGETCFRGSYPHSSRNTLKRKAIDAVKELIKLRLIRKEMIDEGSGYQHNVYHLTNPTEWKPTTETDLSSVNIRKGRTKNSSNPLNPNHPVSPVHPPGEPDSPPGEPQGTPPVSPVHSPGEPQGTPPVNPRVPKGTPIEGTPIEGTPIKVLQEEREDENKKDSTVTANASPRSRGRQKKTAAQIYSELVEPDKFDHWWSWYFRICRQYDGNSGDRAAAADAWTAMFNSSGFDYEKFKEGCVAWAENLKVSPIGEIVHGYVFIRGKNGHPTPYWQSHLETVLSDSNFLPHLSANYDWDSHDFSNHPKHDEWLKWLIEYQWSEIFVADDVTKIQTPEKTAFYRWAYRRYGRGVTA